MNPWKEVTPDGARTHALIVGVSKYPHLPGGGAAVGGVDFGLRQLTAAARSAGEFATWLVEHAGELDKPLGKVWLLLSPSELEVPDVPSDAPMPTRDNVASALRAFKAACDLSEDNVAVVYFAGHGVQDTKDGGMVMLSDFNAPGQSEFHGVVDVTKCRRGMDRADTASVQWWFVDACRVQPDELDDFEEIDGALGMAVRSGPTATTSVLFASTAADTLAYSLRNERTLFWLALRECLERRAVRQPPGGDAWEVTVSELIAQLAETVNELADEHGAEQFPVSGGTIRNAVLCRLPKAPNVDLIVDLHPLHAATAAVGTLLHMTMDPARENLVFLPSIPSLTERVQAGGYLLKIAFDPASGFQEQTEFVIVTPPFRRVPLELT